MRTEPTDPRELADNFIARWWRRRRLRKRLIKELHEALDNWQDEMPPNPYESDYR